jgi:hypothetical protein
MDLQKYYTIKKKNISHYMDVCKTCIDLIKNTTKELKCYICNQNKSISNFRYRQDRYCFEKMCIECMKNKRKQYNQKNIDKIRERDKIYYKSNKTRINDRNNTYYNDNQIQIQNHRKEYRNQNPEKIKQQQKNQREKPNRKLFDPIRRRISKCIGSGKESNNLLGCKMSLLKAWFEFNFALNSYLDPNTDNHMNWLNHGKVWHADHVIPVCSFDLTIPENQQICFNWTNYRPLLAKKNLSKNGKIVKKDIFLHNLRLRIFINKNHLNQQEKHNILLWNTGVLRTAV